MDELLNKLLESELLTEESKQELKDAFNAHITTVTEEAKQQAIVEATAKLHEQHLREKDSLIQAIDDKINEHLMNEMVEFKNDIKAYRDLEAEFAVKLAKEKKIMGEQLKGQLDDLTEKLDGYLDLRLQKEFDEMKQDIFEAKKLNFGVKVFEAFAKEYKNHFVDPDQTEAELTEAKVRLDTLNKKYKNIKKENDKLVHKIKVESVLKPLNGEARELMESILQTTPTDKVEESYKLFIGRVIKDSQKEIIKESAHPEVIAENFSVKTGDDYSIPTFESYDFVPNVDTTMIESYKRLAGIA